MGKQWKHWEILFSWAPKPLQTVTAAVKLRHLLLGRKAMTNLDSILKSRDITDKGPHSQSYGFSSNHVSIWELYYKESWVSKNWCLWAVVLEKILESPLDCKEIKPVNPKGNQSWTFIGRTDAEVLVLWPPDAQNWLTGKDPDVGKDWRQEEKRMTEDEMLGWHHRLDGHEYEQAPGVWWWTGKPGVLQPMGLQRVRHDWSTELNWWWLEIHGPKPQITFVQI